MLDDLVLFRVFIGNSSDSPLVEGRVFAVDAGGEIISQSVSSDKVGVTWQ